MNIAVFDPFSGVSGNMVIGSLIDAGADPDRLREMLGNLGIEKWELILNTVARKGISCTHADFKAHDSVHARHLPEITEIISSSGLPKEVTEKSLEAFGHLAKAESAAHGISPDEVHFHETGAIDAILDITGSFCCLHILDVDQVYSSPVATGTGTLECQHGTLPVPSPATLSLLRGVPVMPSGIEAELATPTGAAILKTAVDSWGVPPACLPLTSGYGAGTRELSRPNFLRVTLCSTLSSGRWLADVCTEIRFIVDDMDLRTWPEVSGAILDAGAFDCYSSMCIGRKGRPALEVTVLCPTGRTDDVTEAVFTNTPTLGMRVGAAERAILSREFRKVETEFGVITVKLGFMDGDAIRLEPEYTDCQKAARDSGVPVDRVVRAARCAAGNLREEGD